MSARSRGHQQSKDRRPAPVDVAADLVADQQDALLHHQQAGGGFESECDESTKDTVRREFFEETGLRVDVGPLVYVREFAEPAAGR
ncbi:NUDIX domain-containing protein, partial [Pseudomonas aeruginosa]